MSARRSQNLAAGALLAAFAAFAQTSFPLERVNVSGNQRISLEKIAEIAGLKIGGKVTKTDFDEARARLMATGAFENVGYAYKPSADNAGFDLIVEVAEVEQLFAYRFEDLPVPDDTLRAALHKVSPFFADEIPVSTQVLDKYVAAVQEQVGSKVKVVANLNSDLGTTMIVFRPNTPRERVAELKFKGNQVLPAEQLTRALAEAAVGTPYSEVSLRAFLDSSVRPLYESRGRLSVKFPNIETHPSLLADGLAVVVIVDEGPSYSLGDVKLTGVSYADSDEMQKVANLKSNDIADLNAVKAGLDRVLAKYHGKGYLRASGKIDRAIDDKDRKVNVEMAIDPGPQFTMGKLEILGLDASSEPEIRKMWKLAAGAPFEPDYPAAFLDDIRAKQIFENLGKTLPETNIDEKTHAVDVKLYFSKAPSDRQRKKPN